MTVDHSIIFGEGGDLSRPSDQRQVKKESRKNFFHPCRIEAESFAWILERGTDPTLPIWNTLNGAEDHVKMYLNYVQSKLLVIFAHVL